MRFILHHEQTVTVIDPIFMERSKEFEVQFAVVSSLSNEKQDADNIPKGRIVRIYDPIIRIQHPINSKILRTISIFWTEGLVLLVAEEAICVRVGLVKPAPVGV